MKPAAIVLMGLSGAGKGTQAFRLAQHLPNFVHFDTGQEIKRRVDDPTFSGDPKAAEQREVYYRGELNDVGWVSRLVCEVIRTYASRGKGVVLSGSPRTVYEAKQVGPLLKEVFGPLAVIVKINVPEDAVRQRMTNRAVCDNSRCGFPSTKELVATLCPQCSKGKLIPKSLDSAEGMTKRIQWYYTETLPAISHLCLLGIPLVDIDGEGEEEEVFSRILASIEENLALKSPDQV